MDLETLIYHALRGARPSTILPAAAFFFVALSACWLFFKFFTLLLNAPYPAYGSYLKFLIPASIILPALLTVKFGLIERKPTPSR